MRHLEVSARTVEEAVQKALAELGVSREEVAITVLEEPGDDSSVDARISVSLPEPGEAVPSAPTTAEITVTAREILEDLLRRLELEASVEAEEVEGGQILLSVQGDDLGILIGRRGQTLAALQYLVRTIISHRLKVKAPLTIDVEGYRQRRIESLQSIARHLADQVVSRREAYMMRPMTPYERRIIHLELAEDPDVTTHSIGTGDGRRVVIEPKRPQPQNP
ncbi:MAG: KH domain-containing protein [Dehalococcoidia bacterium]|nr:MAG: KH domain-containing protein [Dehalococcoidia bacterium]